MTNKKPRTDTERLDWLEREGYWSPNPPHHYGHIGGNLDLAVKDGKQLEDLRSAIDKEMDAQSS